MAVLLCGGVPLLILSKKATIFLSFESTFDRVNSSTSTTSFLKYYIPSGLINGKAPDTPSVVVTTIGKP